MTEPSVKVESSPTPSFKRSSSTSASKSQKSILGFFQRKSTNSPQPNTNGARKLGGSTTLPIGSPKKQLVQRAPVRISQSLTPAPSSDAIEAEEEGNVRPLKACGLPSPTSPPSLDSGSRMPLSSSPTRKVRREVSRACLEQLLTSLSGQKSCQLRRVWKGRRRQPRGDI